MKAQWRKLIIVLVLGASAVACEQNEREGTRQSERHGTGQYFTENECPVVGNSETHIYFLETETMARCSKKIKTERRTIAFALNREWRQRRPATAGLVLVKANEGISCGFGAQCA